MILVESAMNRGRPFRVPRTVGKRKNIFLIWGFGLLHLNPGFTFVAVVHFFVAEGAIAGN